MDDPPRHLRAVRGLAGGLNVLAVLEVAAATILAIRIGWSWSDALEAFVVSNATMGVAFAGCGALLARHRARNPIGWLFLAGGSAQTTAALAAPLGQYLVAQSAPAPLLRLVATIFAWSWPLAIGLGIPLALLLFPDGRPPSSRWRPVIIAVIVTAPLFSLEMGAENRPLRDGLPVGYLTLSFYDALQPLWRVAEVRGLIALLLGFVALVVRYRRGNDTVRRQLLWLILAVLIVFGATVLWGLVDGTPIAVLLAITLIPIAVTVAIIRHQLLDIRLVVSRALAWVLLSLGVLVAYVAVVALLDRVVAAQLGRSALVTVVLALLAAPVLPRLQRLVDRAMYGERDNAASVASKVGTKLATADADLGEVLGAVRLALRLPYAALERWGEVLAAHGARPERVEAVPLAYGGRVVGSLHVGLRPGERALSAADRTALGVVAAPMAVALEAMAMSAERQQSREHIVAATADERRRLRRELHDGLGPTLTGIAFTADAAANLVDSEPARSLELLTALRRDSRVALADVRRIIDDLRPPILDELGLVGALRQRADQLAWRADGTPVQVRVEAPCPVPVLPPAVEVAAYRIATEALTNIARHSRATTALITLECDERLDVSITDDGIAAGSWTPGVGLTAMRERAVELGGSLSAGPSPMGGRVAVWFPLPVSP